MAYVGEDGGKSQGLQPTATMIGTSFVMSSHGGTRELYLLGETGSGDAEDGVGGAAASDWSPRIPGRFEQIPAFT